MTWSSQSKIDVGKNIDESVEVSWTGPAGIASDAVEFFSRADVVLLLSTVGIILVLLLRYLPFTAVDIYPARWGSDCLCCC